MKSNLAPYVFDALLTDLFKSHQVFVRDWLFDLSLSLEFVSCIWIISVFNGAMAVATCVFHIAGPNSALPTVQIPFLCFTFHVDDCGCEFDAREDLSVGCFVPFETRFLQFHKA